jgi:hypothetical protein
MARERAARVHRARPISPPNYVRTRCFKVNKLRNCSITRRDFVGKVAITAFGAAITTSGPGT